MAVKYRRLAAEDNLLRPPGVLTRYFTALFLGRVLTIAGGLTGLLLLFDILANAEDVTTAQNAVWLPLLHYAALRIPDIFILILPLAALFTTINLLIQKVNAHEVTVLRALGIPVTRLAVMFLCGGAVLAGLHLALGNTIQPYTAGLYQSWAERDFRGPAFAAKEGQKETVDLWFAAGNTILKAERASPDGRTLYDVRVIQRDTRQRLADYFTAEKARYDGDRWIFINVSRPAIGDQPAEQRRRLGLALAVDPEIFSRLSDTLTSLSLADLWVLRRTDKALDQPSSVYDTWWHRKWAAPFGIFAMILLAMPLGTQQARRNHLMLFGLMSLGAGFLFFIVERLLLTMGETAALPAILAAWSPVVLFSISGFWALILSRR